MRRGARVFAQRGTERTDARAVLFQRQGYRGAFGGASRCLAGRRGDGGIAMSDQCREGALKPGLHLDHAGAVARDGVEAVGQKLCAGYRG